MRRTPVLCGIISRCSQGAHGCGDLSLSGPAEFESRNKEPMSIAVMIVHILACVGLILVVLLQAGKGASMGAAFGGASQTVFGSSGAATFLAKMTTVVAVLFMITSLSLAYLSASSGPSSVMEQPPAASQSAPAEGQPVQEAQPTAPAPEEAAPAQPTAPAPSSD
jgi:preprotein translocase subunit SecG